MAFDKFMIQNELRGYSITTGELLTQDYITLALTSDSRLENNTEDHHSYFALLFNSKVRVVESVFPIASQCALKVQEEIITISAQGSVRRSSPPPRGGDNEPMIGDLSGKKVNGRTRLTEVVTIEDMPYAVGTRCAAYRRIDQGKWECIDDGCYQADNFSRGFNAIDGFSNNEIYAAGELGEIWSFNGAKWTEVVSPTNASLNAITCAQDGKVYAAGSNGTIVVGRHDQWALLEGIPQGLEFWDIQDHFNDIYLTANTRSVHKLSKSGELKTVDFGDCQVPLSAYHLKARDSSLWLFGSKDIRRLVDGLWVEIATLA